MWCIRFISFAGCCLVVVWRIMAEGLVRDSTSEKYSKQAISAVASHKTVYMGVQGVGMLYQGRNVFQAHLSNSQLATLHCTAVDSMFY
jgi:hypothetical protein